MDLLFTSDLLFFCSYYIRSGIVRLQLDATAFGILAQIYYTPLATDALRLYMEENTPNLVAFLQRIRNLYWKDWDIICQTPKLNKKIFINDDKKLKKDKKGIEENRPYLVIEFENVK